MAREPSATFPAVRRVLFTLFLLSGSAGLVYEVIWIRQFGNVFGNTASTASLVVAVFMGGLGLGGALAGRWADRQYANDHVAPLRLYSRVEIGIALLAAVNAFLLPALGEASAPVSAYVAGAHGWHTLSVGSWVLRYAIASALLLPATTLMGATLTLLIRFVVAADVEAAGLRIGQLYAVNTLGAAAGAFLTDWLFIPTMGLLSTQLLAVALNLLAGLGASRLAKRAPVEAGPPAGPPSGLVDASTPPALLLLTSLAILIAGFSAMGFEIVWFRHLSTMLGGYRSVYSLSLAVILLGIVLGAALGGRLVQRVKRPVEIFLGAQAIFVATTLVALWAYERETVTMYLLQHREAWHAASPAVQALWTLWLQLKPVLLIIGVPAVMMGATFPLANACIQRTEAAVGRRAGVLYLANTVGGVAGSLLTGFVFLPALGSQGSVTLLAGAAASGLVPLFLSARQAGGRPLRLAFGSAVLVTVLAGALWARLEPDFLVKKGLLRVQRGEARLLTSSEAVTETVAVLEANSVRDLYTNGHAMSSSGPGGQRYMRAFSHLPLLMTPAPERVLVICFGVGNTLHAASLHPVKQLELADLSRNVLEHAPWFADASNHGVLEDPRVKVFLNDGRQHLRMTPPGSFDLVTLEPPPIAFAGVSALYSREFYELAKSRLKPGGYMTQWLPAYQVSEDTVRSMIRAFVEVFPNAVLLSGNGRELILFGGNGPAQLDPEQVARALDERPTVRADLARVNLSTMTELVGTFMANPETLAKLTRDALPLTDDYPVLEYSQYSDLMVTNLPEGIADLSGVGAFCPRCFEGGTPVPAVAQLPAYFTLLHQIYASPNFMVTNPLVAPPRLWVELPPETQALIAGSAYLQTFVPAGKPASPPGP